MDLDDNGVWEEGDEFIVSGWGVTSVSNLSFRGTENTFALKCTYVLIFTS